MCSLRTNLYQMLDYNIPGGKLNRGLSVVDTVSILRGRELSEKEYDDAAALGWAVEIVSRMPLFSVDLF